MSIDSNLVDQTDGLAKKRDQGLYNSLLIWLRELLAATFWIYSLLKLFVFEVDTYLLDRFYPSQMNILEYKFFAFIGVLAIIWLSVGNRRFYALIGYVSFYPIIIIFWKIPHFIFRQKSWILAFAILNVIISFFQSAKINFIGFSAFLISSVIIFNSSSSSMLIISMAINFILLLALYIRRFLFVFKPSSVFALYKKGSTWIREYGIEDCNNETAYKIKTFRLEPQIRDLPVTSFNSKQLEAWTSNLQNSVLYNRGCLFFAKKLKDFQDSHLSSISYIFAILLLLIASVYSFAVINYGLFKIDPNHFISTENTSFSSFFYYSYNSFLFNSTDDLKPASILSKILNMTEWTFALLLILILVSLFFSVANQKYTEEIKDVIKGLESDSQAMEIFIRNEFKLNNIEEAMDELEKLKAGLINFIFKISQSIK